MQTFELSDEQVAMLNHIYGRRRNVLIGTLSALPVLIYRLSDNESSAIRLFQIVNILLILVVVAVVFFLLWYRLHPVKKDIKNRTGVYVPITIQRKDLFPYVNKYFFYFDDIKFPNKEVTESEFAQYNEGDVYPIPLAENSGIVVDGFMNYNLL